MTVREFILGPDGLFLLAVLVATAGFAVWVRRSGASGTFAAAGTLDFLYGLLVALLSAVHIVVVTNVRVRAALASSAGDFSYDFRFYSLMLLGAVLLVPALVCVRAAPAITRGDPDAMRRALRATLLLLAVNLPLVPVQPGFAVPFTMGAALNAGTLFWLGRRAGVIGPSAPG